MQIYFILLTITHSISCENNTDSLTKISLTPEYSCDYKELYKGSFKSNTLTPQFELSYQNSIPKYAIINGNGIFDLTNFTFKYSFPKTYQRLFSTIDTDNDGYTDFVYQDDDTLNTISTLTNKPITSHALEPSSYSSVAKVHDIDQPNSLLAILMVSGEITILDSSNYQNKVTFNLPEGRRLSFLREFCDSNGDQQKDILVSYRQIFSDQPYSQFDVFDFTTGNKIMDFWPVGEKLENRELKYQNSVFVLGDINNDGNCNYLSDLGVYTVGNNEAEFRTDLNTRVVSDQNNDGIRDFFDEGSFLDGLSGKQMISCPNLPVTEKSEAYSIAIIGDITDDQKPEFLVISPPSSNSQDFSFTILSLE